MENNNAKENKREVVIQAPNMETIRFGLVGVSPLVICRFSQKAMNMMIEKHKQGSVAKKGNKREARDFNEDYQNAFHKSTEGWNGVSASAFRNALISACRICGFKMTQAKLAVFIVADGVDAVDGLPLVKINGTPRQHTMYVRNETGVCDIRVRPMWSEWSIDLNVRYDADLFSSQDISNLLMRAGMQVGIGEGRPDSRESAGLGWGIFKIKDK